MKAQGLHGNLGDAVEFLLRDFQVSATIGRHLRILYEVQAVGDSGERVINLMRNGRGQAAGNGKLFCPTQNLFRMLAACDVGEKGRNLAVLRSLIGIEKCSAKQHIDGSALMTDTFCFDRFFAHHGTETGEGGVNIGTQTGERDIAAEHFFAAVPEHVLNGCIGVGDATLCVAQQEAKGHGIDESVKASFAGLKRAFCGYA